MARIIDAFTQFFDDNGDPLVDGWLKFNESGTNNTDKDTFADANETVSLKNTNPLQLDGAGRCPNVFGTGAYNVILYKDNNGAVGEQIQQFDPVSSRESLGAFSAWDAETVYFTGDIVTADNGLYYRALLQNQNEEPSTSPSSWEELELLTTTETAAIAHNGRFMTYGGTADAFTLTSVNTAPLKILEDGMEFVWLATATNTGASTVHIDGIATPIANNTVTGVATPAGYFRTDVYTRGVIQGGVLVCSREVELGSNASGEYQRHEDGRQESLVLGLTIVGSGSSLSLGVTGLPAVYVSAPSGFLNLIGFTGSESGKVSLARVINQTTTSYDALITVVAGQTFAGGTTATTDLHFIGSWY